MDMPVKILYNDLNLKLDRGIETFYDISYEYDAIYLDYDDTLIVNDKVNTTLIQVIYQAHNKGKKVYLLTKHIGDLLDSFNRYYLDTVSGALWQTSYEDSNWIWQKTNITLNKDDNGNYNIVDYIQWE
jgi:hypothetical protein